MGSRLKTKLIHGLGLWLSLHETAQRGHDGGPNTHAMGDRKTAFGLQRTDAFANGFAVDIRSRPKYRPVGLKERQALRWGNAAPPKPLPPISAAGDDAGKLRTTAIGRTCPLEPFI